MDITTRLNARGELRYYIDGRERGYRSALAARNAVREIAKHGVRQARAGQAPPHQAALARAMADGRWGGLGDILLRRIARGACEL